MYEARQRKEKVSRRIDGGMIRQRVEFVNGICKYVQPIQKNKDLKSLSYQQNILQKFSVMETNAPSINIEHEDLMGGHTIERHVGKNKEYLHSRANELPERVASCYTDITVANRETTKCIRNNWSQIQIDWAGNGLAGRQGNVCYTTDISAKQNFYLAYNHKGKRKDVSKINVWLCRLLQNGTPQTNMVYVKSSYPAL